MMSGAYDSGASNGHDVPTLEKCVLHFPNGLIGLSFLKTFELVADPESHPFVVLRSMEENLEFVAIDPCDLIPDYQLEVSDEDSTALGITDSTEPPLVLNISTIHSTSPQKVTTNLAAPVLVNQQTGIGRQVLLSNYQQYSMHHVLIDETSEE